MNKWVQLLEDETKDLYQAIDIVPDEDEQVLFRPRWHCDLLVIGKYSDGEYISDAGKMYDGSLDVSWWRPLDEVALRMLQHREDMKAEDDNN